MTEHRVISTRAICKGLEAFAERARKVTRRIVVFLGARSQGIDGVEALPIEDFLAALPDSVHGG